MNAPSPCSIYGATSTERQAGQSLAQTQLANVKGVLDATLL